MTAKEAAWKAIQVSSITVNFRGYKGKVHALAWHPSSEHPLLALGSTDHSVRLGIIKQDADIFAASTSSSSSNTVVLCDTVELKSDNGHCEAVDQVAWCPVRPHWLASASSDKSVCIWDTQSNKLVKKIDLSAHRVVPLINLTWLNGDEMVVGDKRDRLVVFDWRTAEVIANRVFDTEMNEMVVTGRNNLKSPSKESELFVATGSGKVSILNAKTLEDINPIGQQLTGHTSNCYTIDFSEKGWMAVGAADATVSIWRRQSEKNALFPNQWETVHALGDLEWPVRSVALTKGLYGGNAPLVAGASEDPFIAIWDAASAKLMHKLPTTLPTHTSSSSSSSTLPVVSPVNKLAWSPPYDSTSERDLLPDEPHNYGHHCWLAWSMDEQERSGKVVSVVKAVAIRPLLQDTVNKQNKS